MPEIEDYLNQYSEENPFTILLAGENISDGIGDFVHLYDFNKYLKEKYKDEKRVKIQCISFIDDEKLNIINRLYGTNFKITEDQFVSDKVPEKSPLGSVGNEDQNGIIFFRRKSTKSESEMAQLEFIKKNKNIDLLFSVSIHSGKLKAIQPRSIIFLGEYEYGNLYAREPCDKIRDGIWQFNRNMGIAPDRAGIKIIQPIVETRKVLEEKKDQEDTFLAAGYMQSRFQSDIFIMNCLALANNKSTINIITNFEGFNSKDNELFYGDKLNHYIKSFNLSRVEVVSPNGEILFENDIENTGSKRVLRIIQFKNISEHDKNLLFARADSVGASGDTSCSELISSMAFPCIVKKDEFVGQLINQSAKFGLSILQNYLELLNSMISLEKNSFILSCVADKNFGALENALYTQYENKKIAQFIAEHHQEIQSQWCILCNWIIENRNVFDFTDYLIDGAMKHSAGQLKPGDVDEKYNATKFGPKNQNPQTSTNIQNLRHFSVFLSEKTKQPNILNQEERDEQQKQTSVKPPTSGGGAKRS